MPDMKSCEIVLLHEDGTWETEIVEIPKSILEQDSQDAFIKWAYSDDEKAVAFREGVHRKIVAFYIWQWEPDPEDPRLVDEEDECPSA